MHFALTIPLLERMGSTAALNKSLTQIGTCETCSREYLHINTHTHMRQQQFNKTKTALESRARSLLLDSIRSIGAGEDKFIYPTEWFQEGVVESTTTLSKFLVQSS